MDRLTERFENGQVGVAGCGKNCKYSYKYCENAEERCPVFNEIYEKLAAYEDAEEQGLLLRLPCKVGDKLYRITPYVKEQIITTHVLQMNIKQFFNEKIIVRIDVMDKMGESCYFLDDIGKNVFLSREEAEAKLKEMEGEDA